MNIVKNLITDYFSANFAEDETEWQPLPTVYQNGDEARDGHYIYNYAGVNGTNSTTSPSTTPLSWEEARASNYYAMLGDRTDQQTIVNGDLIIEIDISNYDTISLLNVKGTQIEIEMTDLDTMDIVFTDTKNLSNTEDIIDAYTHYFSPFVYFDRYYNRLPLFGNARVKITISALNGQSAIGRLVCGESYNVGISLFGASQNLSSYSKNVTNEFGTKSLVQEDVVYDSSYQILIPSAKVENVKRKRKDYAGVPVLFIGDPEVNSSFENLLSYGEWQNADILLSNPTNSTVSMTVKELL